MTLYFLEQQCRKVLNNYKQHQIIIESFDICYHSGINEKYLLNWVEV
jgi:hypothetical protein